MSAPSVAGLPLLLLSVAVSFVPLRAAAQGPMRSAADADGNVVLAEGDRPVLRYVYQTTSAAPEVLAQVAPGNRKHAQPRSNYIHPLYGLDGQELTRDWAHDHPHHRGIYWAWPEVQYQGKTADLHALQNVFARPTGTLTSAAGDDFAEVVAENRWMWEDKTPITLETVTLRAWRAGEHGRYVDLTVTIRALEDGVTIARRRTDMYGGLNTRLSPVRDLKLAHHVDPPGASPRRAWSESVGIRGRAEEVSALTIFEDRRNPEFPADYIQFPELPWFGPTFPVAGKRFALSKSAPLVLRYRYWIRPGGALTPEQYAEAFDAFQAQPAD